MALKSPKVSGMAPVNLLSARSRTCSELKFARLDGISPENAFDLRLSILSCGKPPPIHGGMLPDSLLFPRSNVSKLDKFCKDNGSFPVRLLLLR
ncbi:hypothetical protein NC651_002677 [Populus alba x Populus x berolinensis]|nr:hypothetical protein NC651_002677 [Populus alba x Populus x berolinensis]